MRILNLAARRLAASIPTLILILIGVFLLLQFAAGELSLAPGAARPRFLLDLRQAGLDRDPGAVAADNSFNDLIAVVCVLLRPAVRRDRRTRRQPVAGHAD